jgi:dienelactone hydrolase
MIKEELAYGFNGREFKSTIFYEETDYRLPAVLVLPTWMGLDDFAFKKGSQIATLGYLVCVVDLFGNGIKADNREHAKELIIPLVEDRSTLRGRLKKTVEEIRGHPVTDKQRQAAIGYCFGGACALDFAKSGYNLRGVVSVHGVFGNPHQVKMKPVSTAERIPASILVLHGYKDALSSEQDIRAFEKEMNDKGADWQMIIYGRAMHAYTNPQAHMPEKSLQYDELTANRSFLAKRQFLEEIFK